jgi:hypothetical protein
MANLSWEACWIRDNLNRYESKGHAEAVILNIQKRLVIDSLVKENNELRKQLKEKL